MSGELLSLPLYIDCIGANVHAVKQTRWANYPASAYVTGGFPVEWSEMQILSFIRHIRLAQSPAAFVDDGSDARGLDVERFAATPADWVDFHRTRTDTYDETCYCSISTIPSVIAACDLAGIPLPSRWWIAWWWKQAPGVALPFNVDVPYPTIQQLLAEISFVCGEEIAARIADHIWSCQFVHYAELDVSVVYGTPDFART